MTQVKAVKSQIKYFGHDDHERSMNSKMKLCIGQNTHALIHLHKLIGLSE